MDFSHAGSRRRFRRFALSLAALAVFVSASFADPQVSANGFVTKHEASIDAPPAAVYQALVGHVGEWWHPAHTYSGEARNLSIEARPGGCFCEQLPNGGGIEHMRVIYVAPGEAVRMVGALGPLQEWGLTGSLTWTVAAGEPGTVVRMTYAVGGFIEGGFDEIAPLVSQVLELQLARLKSFAETGMVPTGD